MHPYFEKKNNRIYISYNENNYSFPSHFHSNLEIAHCIEGKQDVKLGNRIYTLHSGDTLLISPNTIHEYIKSDNPEDEKTRVVAIICGDNLLAESVPDIIIKTPQNPHLSGISLTENAKLAFDRIYKTKDNAELLGWMFIVISYLLKNLEFETVSANSSLPSEITAYVEKNYKEDITIKHLAKAFGYHPSYIAHIFCDQLKVPFRTYLGSLRSEYAATQIKTTDKSLTEIAYDSGFNSLNTFCRCFKKHYSLTPSQYKKECKNKS